MTTRTIDSRTGQAMDPNRSNQQSSLPGENQPTIDLQTLREQIPKIVRDSPYMKSVRGE